VACLPVVDDPEAVSSDVVVGARQGSAVKVILRDRHDRPVPGVIVTLDLEGARFVAMTDRLGGCTFAHVPARTLVSLQGREPVLTPERGVARIVRIRTR